LDEKQKICWNPKNIRKYFRASLLQLIQKLQDAGSLIMVASILLLASVALLLAVALTYLSLMIHIVSRTLFPPRS
jgi:hypothetical protein